MVAMKLDHCGDSSRQRRSHVVTLLLADKQFGCHEQILTGGGATEEQACT